MREITRRQMKKAAGKALLFLGLMALMMVPNSSETIPETTGPKALAAKRMVMVSIPDRSRRCWQ